MRDTAWKRCSRSIDALELLPEAHETIHLSGTGIPHNVFLSFSPAAATCSASFLSADAPAVGWLPLAAPWSPCSGLISVLAAATPPPFVVPFTAAVLEATARPAASAHHSDSHRRSRVGLTEGLEEVGALGLGNGELLRRGLAAAIATGEGTGAPWRATADFIELEELGGLGVT